MQLTAVDFFGADTRLIFPYLPVYDPEDDGSPGESGDVVDFIPVETTWTHDVDIQTGYELEFSLTQDGSPVDPALGIEIDEDGVITWTPSLDLLVDESTPDFGTTYLDERVFNFHIVVNVIGGSEYVIPLELSVIQPSLLEPGVPVIDEIGTPAPNAAIAMETLVYEPTILPIESSDYANNSVTWYLDEKPVGMEIDPNSGRISWSPGQDEIDHSYQVRLRVENSIGAGTSYTFVLDVKGLNELPRIENRFPSVWRNDVPFSLDVIGLDPEGHHLSYELIDPYSTGMIIDSETGHIAWENPEGHHEFTVRVLERHRPENFIEKTLDLIVLPPDLVNLEPLFQNNPEGLYASLGKPFEFEFDVLDSDQIGNFTFEVHYQHSSDVSISNTGLMTWVPRSLGEHVFEVVVRDQSPNSTP